MPPTKPLKIGERDGLQMRLNELDEALAAGDLDLAARSMEMLATAATRIARRIREALLVEQIGEWGLDIARRCKIAANNGGEPSAAWAAGEKIAVALVLGNHDYLRDVLEYSVAHATSRTAAEVGIAPDQMSAWMTTVRTAAELGNPGA